MASLINILYVASTLPKPGEEELIPDKKIVGELTWRMMIGTTGFCSFFVAFSYLPIHIINTIINFSSFVTYIIRIAIGKSRFTLECMSILILCLMGVFFIVNQHIFDSNYQVDSTKTFSLIGIFFISIFTTTKGLFPIVVESMPKHNKYHFILFNSVSNLIASGVLLTLGGKGVIFELSSRMFYMVLYGLLSLLYFIMRFKIIEHSGGLVMTVLDTLTLVLSLLHNALWLKKETTITGWIGGFLVVFSASIFPLVKK